MAVDISRHREIVNPNEHTHPIRIVGCGATGSWVATILAKMGFKEIHLYDFDVVEEHNLANQNYGVSDVGLPKVTALKNLLTNINKDATIVEHNEAVTNATALSGIVFLLTDTMSSRKEIYEGAIKDKIAVKLLIETRMGSSQGIIYSIIPGRSYEQKAYEQTLYSDEVSEVSFCGSPISVITTAMSVAAQAVWQMINYLNNAKDFQQEIQIEYRTVDSFKQNFLP